MSATNNPQSNMDDLLKEIREERIDSQTIENSAQRAWARISQETGAQPVMHVIRGCADFQAMMPAWREGTLAEARRTLLEDHIHECVNCRHAAEAGKVVQFPKLGQAPAPRRKMFWHIPAVRYAMAAALFIGIGIGGWDVIRSILKTPFFHPGKATVQTADGQLFRLSGSGLVALKAGEQVPPGAEIRTARNAHAMIQLKDGSMVEMRERSAFTVEESTNDVNVKLVRGQVIVQASKRASGHLFVTTPDCRVAVTGTVFSVDAGVKGSRVAVIEGEVHVDQENNDTVLHPGDQKSTDASMQPVSIRDQIAWSANVSKHLELLHEMQAIQKDLANIPQPGMRYSSRLLQSLPQGTVFYMAIPNVSKQLGQANEIIAQRATTSPVLQQWLNQGNNGKVISSVMSTIQNFGDYLGDEIVVAASIVQQPNGSMSFKAPVLMAELKRGGFKDFAERETQRLAGNVNGGKEVKVLHFVDDPSSITGDGSNGILTSVQGNFLLMTPEAEAMRLFAPGIEALAKNTGAQTGSSPFLDHIKQVYSDGVGFIFAADLGAMSAAAASHDPQHKGLAPLGNVQHLMIQQRDLGTSTDTRAVMTFSGPRQGIFGWLAKPSPMAALDYVTSTAGGVTSFAIDNPAKVIQDMVAWTNANDPNGPQDLSQAEQKLGFSIQNDLAASLGSEFVIAVDGPLLPTPAWKIVVEVYDPQKLQWVFTKLEDDYNSQAAQRGRQALQTSQEVVGSRTYYRVVFPDVPMTPEIDYLFDGGYFIAAPSRQMLDQAIQAKQTGNSLTHASAFRNALPKDGQTNFSAMAYQNFGLSLSSALQGLGNRVNPQMRQKLQSIANDGQASMITAYGESDRIVVTSPSLIGFGNGALMNVTGPLGLFSLLGSDGITAAHSSKQ